MTEHIKNVGSSAGMVIELYFKVCLIKKKYRNVRLYVSDNNEINQKYNPVS